MRLTKWATAFLLLPLSTLANPDFTLELLVWYSSLCCSDNSENCLLGGPGNHPPSGIAASYGVTVGTVGTCHALPQIGFSATTAEVGQGLFNRGLKIVWFSDSQCTIGAAGAAAQSLTNKDNCNTMPFGATNFKLTTV